MYKKAHQYLAEWWQILDIIKRCCEKKAEDTHVHLVHDRIDFSILGIHKILMLIVIIKEGKNSSGSIDSYLEILVTRIQYIGGDDLEEECMSTKEKTEHV